MVIMMSTALNQDVYDRKWSKLPFNFGRTHQYEFQCRFLKGWTKTLPSLQCIFLFTMKGSYDNLIMINDCFPEIPVLFLKKNNQIIFKNSISNTMKNAFLTRLTCCKNVFYLFYIPSINLGWLWIFNVA